MDVIELKRLIKKCLKYYGILGIFIGIIVLIFSFTDSSFSVEINNTTIYGVNVGICLMLAVPIILVIMGFFQSLLMWYPVILLYRNDFKLIKASKKGIEIKSNNSYLDKFISFVRRTFLFSGRIDRLIYGFVLILLFIIQIIVTLRSVYLGMVGNAIDILLIICYCSITVKRLHDMDYRGINLLMFCVPIYNFYMLFLVLFSKGTEGANFYDTKN